jgi:hypothetical protein
MAYAHTSFKPILLQMRDMGSLLTILYLLLLLPIILLYKVLGRGRQDQGEKICV